MKRKKKKQRNYLFTVKTEDKKTKNIIKMYKRNTQKKL